MPGGDQLFRGNSPALDVIGKDLRHLAAGNILIQQNDALVTLNLFTQQAVIGAVGGEQQAVNLAGIQPANELALFFRVVAGDAQHQAVAAGRSGLLGGVGQFGEEGVGDIGEDQTEGFAAPFAKAACQAVSAIVQLADRRFNAVDSFLRQHDIVVHIAR